MGGGLKSELCALFDPERTMRLVCPTKALATHGYRFAYALLPKAMHGPSAHIYANIYGSATVDNLAFARIVPELLSSGTITGPLMRQVAERHRLLRTRGAISAPWQPSCGYFIFEQIAVNLTGGTLLMDGSYFEQKRYPNYRRINLLSPSLQMLG
jgi:hypothetical protein